MALDELLRVEVAVLKARIRGGGRLPAGAEVSDIAQDAVLKLLQVGTAPHFDHPRAFRAYLWTAAWHLLADRLRKPGPALRRLDPTESGRVERGLSTTGGLSAVDLRDQLLALEFALNLLSCADQEILRLHYLRDLPTEAAAAELGISRDAAKMRLSRARRNLGQTLLRWNELIG